MSEKETDTTISQKEYLKKYLAMGKAPGQKKKKKKKRTTNKLNIIDDDADVNTATNNNNCVEDILLINEDAPQIVAIIDERPPSMRVDEKTKNPLWQPIGTASNFTNVDVEEEKERISKFSLSFKQNENSHKPKDSLLHVPKSKTLRMDYSASRREKYDDEISLLSTADQSVNMEDYSPPRKTSRGDLSPPRIRRINDLPRDKKDRAGDLSPPRKGKLVRDVSPPRKKMMEDMSPPRRKTNKDVSRYSEHGRNKSHSKGKTRWDNDLSSLKNTEGRSKPQLENELREKRSKKMEKTLDGKSAGLQHAHKLIEETTKQKLKEDKFFNQLSNEISGENAQVVFRDRKTGNVRNLQQEKKQHEEKQRQEEKNKEKYLKWGRGLAQMESRDQQIQEELHEMSKPLARYADDEDLEKFLKEQEREGDPMLAYIRKKKRKEAAYAGEVEKPKFEGNFMPNRFGIAPGQRWDGVDRSNGYEKKWFEVQNEKKARQEDIYKWSTEDM